MSIGKMNTFAEIIEIRTVKDKQGFSVSTDIIIASIRAYKEDRHGSVAWKNRAVFSEATALFRFRTIPNITITTANIIVCDNGRYEITSVEDMKNRGMYIELLAKKVVSNGKS